MSFVISANYRDRDSEYPWLIRKSEEPIEAARACRRVNAINARFCSSKDGESGFGCTVVAVAEQAEGFDFEDIRVMVPLKFHGWYGFQDPKGDTVKRVQSLSLTEDRKILAEL